VRAAPSQAARASGSSSLLATAASAVTRSAARATGASKTIAFSPGRQVPGGVATGYQASPTAAAMRATVRVPMRMGIVVGRSTTSRTVRPVAAAAWASVNGTSIEPPRAATATRWPSTTRRSFHRGAGRSKRV
jgi:hypothetical protein